MSKTVDNSALVAKLTKTRYITSIALISLIVITMGWELWWAPIRSGGSWMALKALPLCLLIPGILKGKRYTYQYSSLVILFYFAEAVMRVFDKDFLSQLLALMTVFLCLVFFIGCLIFAKKSAQLPEKNLQSLL